MARQTSRQAVAAILAGWGISLSKSELDLLVPAYEHLLKWQEILEEMLQQKRIAKGMTMPASEPTHTHWVEKE